MNSWNFELTPGQEKPFRAMPVGETPKERDAEYKYTVRKPLYVVHSTEEYISRMRMCTILLIAGEGLPSDDQGLAHGRNAGLP